MRSKLNQVDPCIGQQGTPLSLDDNTRRLVCMAGLLVRGRLGSGCTSPSWEAGSCCAVEQRAYRVYRARKRLLRSHERFREEYLAVTCRRRGRKTGWLALFNTAPPSRREGQAVMTKTTILAALWDFAIHDVAGNVVAGAVLLTVTAGARRLRIRRQARQRLDDACGSAPDAPSTPGWELQEPSARNTPGADGKLRGRGHQVLDAPRSRATRWS